MAGTVAPLGGAPVFHRSKGVVRLDVALTCDASGVITAVDIGEAWGRLVGICYDGGLDASAVVKLLDTKTGVTLFTLTTGTEGTPVFMRPSVGIVDTAGAAIAAGATAPNTNRDIKIAGKVQVSVTSGGVSETGRIAFIVDEAGLGTKGVNV